MTLFADLSFLFLSTLNIYCIDIFYQFDKEKKDSGDITKVKREEINLNL